MSQNFPFFVIKSQRVNVANLSFFFIPTALKKDMSNPDKVSNATLQGQKLQKGHIETLKRVPLADSFIILIQLH